MHDVDRYRGSCLIVAKPRGGRGHSRGRRGGGGGGSGGGGGHDSPHRHQQQHHHPHHNHPGGPQPQGSHGAVDASGYVLEGGSPLTGMPLFSFLPQRRGGASRSGSTGRPQHQQRPPSQRSPSHHHQHIGGFHDTSGEGSPPPRDRHDSLPASEDGDEFERLPLARLALHTQGVPLILPTRGSQRSSTASPPSDNNTMGGGGGMEVMHADATTTTPPPISDAISVTSDEGSIGHAENMLPRIIKPRKRRKKDRKPVTGTGSGQGCGGDTGGGLEAEAGDCPGSIVTLKPYMPMCYNYEVEKCEASRVGAMGRGGGGDNNNRVECKVGGTCVCGQCVAGHVFPTPPPSPASSTSTVLSGISSASSSCSSSSEDEPGCGGGGLVQTDPGGTTQQLVRSLSEPHPRPTIHISSSVTHSFAGHRDLDIRILRSFPQDVPTTTRTRHWSFPAPSRGNSLPMVSTASPASISDHHYIFPSYSNSVTTPHPPQRPWVPLIEPDRSKPSCIFTVMCYNVLCDKYATRQMYGYCPSWALDWEYRKKGIMDEIKQYLADIITLQEVETDQFFNFFLPELKSEGYDGIFSPKSRAKHMTESERKYVDGCAIFWRTTKFSLVKEHLIEFNQLAMANHDGSEDMLNRVMTKDNIGLAALLETKEAAWDNSAVLPDKSQVAQPVLVCTAHIHWDPEFRDVKLIQTIMLMSEIKQIINRIVEEFQPRTRSGQKLDPGSIHLLMCGDLNSLPESGVVEFLTKGNVSMDHEDFKGFGYKTCLQKIANNTNNSLVNTNSNLYTHSFRLAAAYDFTIMAYTNYTYDFKGIIDYIFHSADTMSSLGVLGPIDPDWFRDNKVMGCPHPHVPSDHFPLLVQLEMKPAPKAMNHPNGLLHR